MGNSDGEIRVIFIDDEQNFLDLAEKYFEREGGFQLDFTTSAKEGLELIEEGNYDAVVADYQMPGMDGLELLETLRNRGNHIPYIVLTGKGEEEVAMRAINLGADRYLIKTAETDKQFERLTRAIVEEVIRKKSETELKARPELLKKIGGIINFI